MKQESLYAWSDDYVVESGTGDGLSAFTVAELGEMLPAKIKALKKLIVMSIFGNLAVLQLYLKPTPAPVCSCTYSKTNALPLERGRMYNRAQHREESGMASVMVYYFTQYNIVTDETVHSARPATLEAIAKIENAIVMEETDQEVETSRLRSPRRPLAATQHKRRSPQTPISSGN